MKTILLFGDSNTWGFIPGTDANRMPWGARIPETVQAKAGSGFRIVEEALRLHGPAPVKPDRFRKTLIFRPDQTSHLAVSAKEWLCRRLSCSYRSPP